MPLAVKIVQLLPGKSHIWIFPYKQVQQPVCWVDVNHSYPGSRRRSLVEEDQLLVVPLAISLKAQRLWNLLLHMAGESLEVQLCPKNPNLLWKEDRNISSCFCWCITSLSPSAHCSRWGMRKMPVYKDKLTLPSWIGFSSHHCHVWSNCESPSAGKIGKKPTGKRKAEMNHRTSHHRMEISIFLHHNEEPKT